MLANALCCHSRLSLHTESARSGTIPNLIHIRQIVPVGDLK
jgi:hypothetical protein